MKTNKYDYVVWLLMAAVGYIYYASTVIRTEEGFNSFWGNADIVAVNSISHIILWALIVGYVLKVVISRTRMGATSK